MSKIEEIIKGCKEYNAHYQKALYSKYASNMMSLCVRYSSDREEAKDLLQEGFIKIYDKISQYNGQGAFEGWMKRIMVNTAIDLIRKKRKSIFVQLDPNSEFSNSAIEETEHYNLMEEVEDNYSYEELIAAINTLREEFKIVFNMFVIEDYSHKEIAELLSIKEETSRSRLIRAKTKIREFLLTTKKENTSYVKK